MSSGRGPVITYHALVSSNSSPAGLSQFLDHRVNGRALFPGAGFFEMADAAVNFGRAGSSPTGMSANGEKNAPACLGSLTIPAPLILGGGGKSKSKTPSTSAATPAVSVTIDGATGGFEIVSGAGGARVAHLQENEKRAAPRRRGFSCAYAWAPSTLAGSLRLARSRGRRRKFCSAR